MQDLEDYIEAHISPEPELLHKIDRLTNLRFVNGRMCSGHLQGRLLTMMTRMIKPRKVLEIGTFSGYSALSIAEGMDEGELHTIEIDDELEEFILSNFSSSPVGKKITLHIGDAVGLIPLWKDEEFDLIFIDGDKRNYTRYLDLSLPKLKPGGFIIADNTLWDGHVVETGKHSSQTKGVMEFNDTVAARKDLECVILPVRDGLSIIRKKSPDPTKEASC